MPPITSAGLIALCALLATAVTTNSCEDQRRLRWKTPSNADEIAWRLFAENNSQDRRNWTQWKKPDDLQNQAEPVLDFLRQRGFHPDVQDLFTGLPGAREKRAIDSILERFALDGSLPGEVAYYNDDLVTALTQQNLLTPWGRAQAFQTGNDSPPAARRIADSINLGAASVAVKIARLQAPVGMESHYFMLPRDVGNRYGVVGFHLTSRILPIWLWATWEQTDEIAKHQSDDKWCCHDSFGWDAKRDGPSQALQDLMRDSHVPDVWWKYYRLVGTQTSFVDSVGNPTHLGNYQLEDPLDKASCATCHAQAAFDSSGWAPFGNPLAPDGAPMPSWFNQPGRKLLQLDFLWALIVRQSLENEFREKGITPRYLENLIDANGNRNKRTP